MLGLRQANEIAQSLSGCLETSAIAGRITDGLVEKFGCAFARIWIVERDVLYADPEERAMLKLVASSGMYTRLDGAFARVPMGAFKVGKIAQHGIPFLSNQLADELWVKDREWAIAHQIRGFAGYPLATAEQVIGVLAVFSQQAMEPEFLEILQGLCTTVTVALDNALHHQQEQQFWHLATKSSPHCAPLSEQLAHLLQQSRLALLGTERPLTTSLDCLFLRAGEILNQLHCIYGRLTYGDDHVSLEAMVSTREYSPDKLASPFQELLFATSYLGGTLQINEDAAQKLLQVLLVLPYSNCILGLRLRIRCVSPALQFAFTHLSYLAGLTVCLEDDLEIPVLTDDLSQVGACHLVLMVTALPQLAHPSAKQVMAKLDLSMSADQLQDAIASVTRGEPWNIKPSGLPGLSEREQEVMALLVKGLRDRDIAHHLTISESTVKFHMNNVVSKLKVRTRYQAIHQAIVNGWIT
ncbi:GAF domain-containing protein [Myxacorys almedinensis A]|uniref:GAF domain-containing protein n=1 Tax=Myxacorys almedinensis A TaxID=2690445 RepID=A0A8J7Z4E7_9CYAN|nr:LuxR C-terminal-related transcriptional regulator [Myxacorys almedinensis]NDJ19569.1 GAF domain-containing protein [Myxacorys almedinensis A]